MKVLGIDPGFERVGIAVLEKKGGRDTAVYSSCFTTPSNKLFHERLALIGNELRRVIKKETPDALAIETLLFNTNQKTAMQVAEARGVVIYEAVQHGLAVFEYTPLQIKTAVTGYGRADKKQVIAMVEKLATLSPVKHKRLDDEYDAIAVALTHTATPMQQ